MNRAHIERLLVGFFLVLSQCLSAQGEVFVWNAGNGNWNDPENWLVNGNMPNNIPGAEDNVFLKATNSISVNITQPIEVNSLTVQGNVKFNTKKYNSISVNGSVILSEQTTLSNKLIVSAIGQADNSFTSIPKNLEKNIEYGNQNAYSKFPLNSAKSAAGSCPFFTIIPNSTPPTCNGFTDGIASIEEPTDGVGPYAYQWVGGPASQQWTNRSAGTYTIIVIDIGQGGLPCNLDVFINEPGPLTVFSMNESAPLCADVCNGTATPIVIGGNGGYTYDWSSGETGIFATMLCPTFTLEVTDQLGCQFDTVFTFTNVPDTIQFNAVVSNVTCFGDDDGMIDMTVSGGVPPFTYSWSGPNGFTSGSESISGLEPGDYTLQVEDANNCLADSSFTIIENPVLTANVNTTDNLCGSGSEGAIDLVINGGLPPYIVSWTGPNGFTSTDEDIFDLESGLYEATIEDAGGCIITQQAEIFEPSEIDIDLSATDLLCFEDFTGTASALASGGTPDYSYSWTGPNGFVGTGSGITGLESGMYYVTVTDNNACDQLDSIFIDQPDALLLDLLVSEITCNNGTDGEIDLTISGGTPAFDVSWTGPNGFTSSDEDIQNLEAGTYSVTVTDQNGCIISDSAELLNPDALQITGLTVDVSCNGGSDGSIDLTVNGGTPDYSFSWTGPNGYTSTSEDIIDLEAGDYTVTVTDLNGCQDNQLFTVGSASSINGVFIIFDVACFGEATGSINSTITGGTPPYTPSWTGPNGYTSSDLSISNLEAGDYFLEIIDANNCIENFTATIGQSPEIIIDETISDATCFGFADGSIEVEVSGGNPGYTYSWVGPNGFTSDQEDIADLEAGTYTLTVTDITNCVVSEDFELNEPQQLILDAIITDVLCAGETNGAISLNVSGGVSGYTFNWTGPNGYSSADQNISDLEAGTYFVEVTDNQLCLAQATYEVNETFVLTASPTIIDLSCFGANDGSIEVIINGGQEPYTIDWTGPNGFTAQGNIIQDLEAGDYVMTATDDNGCIISETYQVNSPNELIVDIDSTDLSCTDANDGSATAVASGGSPDYSFSWIGPNGFSSSDASISSLEPGTYTVTLTDSQNCSVQNSVQILNPLPISIDLDITQPSCTADDGVLTAIPSGGTVSGDYAYSWLDETLTEISTSPTITDLAPGIYTIIVSDDNDCTAQFEIELERSSFTLDAVLMDATCLGLNDGSISLTPVGGNPDYTYSWTGPNGFASNDQNISGLEPGLYTVQVIDAESCVTDETYEIFEPNPILASGDIINESCPGSADGSIEITISGGTPGYLVSWTGPNGFLDAGVIISNLEPGTYEALITDVNGCQANESFEVGIDSDYDIITTPSNPLCDQESSGAIDTEIDDSQGGVAPYTYSWVGPNGFASADPDISNLPAGQYILIVEDANSCAQTDTVNLVYPDPISVDLNINNSNCGQADGSAEAFVTGGTQPFTYSWLDNTGTELSTNSTLDNIPAGTYTLNVLDENGCTESATVVITNVNGSIDGEITNPTCNGGFDAMITIAVINGTAPYTYEWSDGVSIVSTDDTLMNVNAGTYIVSVEDVNGCIYSETFEIIDPVPIQGNPVITGVSCIGNDGAISLSITGGDAPYTISWTGPDGFSSNDQDIFNLVPGDYTYVILDGNNCLGSETITVDFIPDLMIDAVLTNVDCGGGASGAIDLSIFDGVPPYTVEWSDQDGVISDQEDLMDLAAGEYTVTVTDLAGCEVTETYEINENPPIEFDFTITQPDCGIANGSILVLISGGVVSDDYFYTWTDQDGNPLPTQVLLNNLDVGLYTLFVSDDLGCSRDTTIALSNPDGQIDATVINLTCAGANDGSIELDVQGVEEPYAVGWTGPNGFTSIEEDISSLEPGIYTYFITGNDACSYTEQFEITSPDPILVDSELTNSCFGENSGAISIGISGGTPDYTVSWTGPNGFTSSDLSLIDLEAGNYQLNIVDQNACIYNDSFDIIENDEIQVDADIINILCFGDNSGSISLNISGGEAPFETNWSGPDGFISSSILLEDLVPGIYELNITGAANCTFSSNYEITEPDSIQLTENIESVGCSSPGSLGQIEIIAEGGVEPYAISWTGPDGFVSNDFILSDLQPGTYSYSFNDNNGCNISGEIEILVVTPIVIDILSENISCNGNNDGSINVSVSGGQGPYSLLWAGPDGFTSILSELDNLSSGTYTLEVTDAAGCNSSSSVDIIEPDALQASIVDLVDATCNSSEDGSLLIETAGGTEPYSYSWTGPNNFESTDESLVFIGAGTYTLNLTDANGCETQLEANIDFEFTFNAVAPEDQSICFSDQPLTLIGTIEGDLGETPSFNWTDLDGTVVSSDSSLVLNYLPGIYGFVFSATGGVCSDSDTLFVEILEGPDADAGPDLEVFAEENFQLGGDPTSVTGVEFAWTPNTTQSFDTTLANPNGFILETTEFVVIVTDADGCSNSDTVLVEVLPEVAISSGFTPNGDGINDFWVIDNMELFPNNVVQIFNRWGNVLYESNGYNMGTAWDGKYDNKDVPAGTYYYTIELNDPRFPDPITGPITINR